MPMKVAIIGAGPFGLCTLRHLAGDPENFEPVAFDKQREVGGLWIYSDNTTHDEYGLPGHHSIYKELRVNLSKEIVGFPDYPLPDELPSYPHNTEMNKYLQNYATDFDLLKYIKFQVLVKKVKPVTNEGRVTWDVTTRDLVTESDSTTNFDAVMVCTGHEVASSIPDIAGKETFQGQVIHSKNYRDPEEYRDKTVVVLGMSFSGLDLLYLVSPTAEKVYVSHNLPEPAGSKLPINVIEKPGIREIVQDGVIFRNGDYVHCDVIMFATGFQYTFPFLMDGIMIRTDQVRVTPLYKHIFHIECPTLCFIGLAKRVLLFKLANAQAMYACAVLRGDVKLPSESDMRTDEEDDYQRRIVDAKQHPKMTHDLCGPAQWEYFDFLSSFPNIPNVTKLARKLWDYHMYLWTQRFHDFRSLNFRILNDEEYEVIESIKN